MCHVFEHVLYLNFHMTVWSVLIRIHPLVHHGYFWLSQWCLIIAEEQWKRNHNSYETVSFLQHTLVHVSYIQIWKWKRDWNSNIFHLLEIGNKCLLISHHSFGSTICFKLLRTFCHLIQCCGNNFAFLIF
jgi:hypothetical protein